MIRIRASLISIGGATLAGLMAMLLVILWIAFHVPHKNLWLEYMLAAFCLGMCLYVIDGISETLIFENGTVVFDGWFTRRRSVRLSGVEHVVLVHEGLNTEWGIETITFHCGNKEIERLPLGPLWRHGDLESFLLHLETYCRDHRFVEEIR